MKIAYFDCFSGVSGDMVLGSLLDIGVDFNVVRDHLDELPLTDYVLAAKPATRGGIGATKVSVQAVEKGLVRTFSNIRQLIAGSDLDPQVRERSLAIFEILAQAQAKVYRKNVETVHFHEVGAIDSIVDIVGAAIGFALLNVDKIYFSPLPMGLGMVRTDHGMLPVPSPVTLEILKGAPIYSTGMQAELVTPTGAAIARSYADDFRDLPPLVVENIGHGAGRAEMEVPNILRLLVGESTEAEGHGLTVEIRAAIDGSSADVLGAVVQRLINLGATDAWTSPATKPGVAERAALTVLAPIDKEESLVQAIFAETGADDVLINKVSTRHR